MTSIASSISPLQTTTATAGNRMNDISSEEFVKIIFAELQRQDPTKPNDTNALLQQMSTLRKIQSDIELSDRLKAIVSENQLSSAGSLLGKAVTGIDENGNRVEGIVRSVSRTKDGPVLNLRNGARLSYDRIDQLLDPPSSNNNSGSNTNNGTNTSNNTGGGNTNGNNGTNAGGGNTNNGNSSGGSSGRPVNGPGPRD